MPTFTVNVINKATNQKQTLQVSGQPSQQAANDHVLKMPGASGGGHPGFELDKGEPAKADAEHKPETLAEQAADLLGKAIADAIHEEKTAV